MKICYIPSQVPYGNGEQFILPEINELILNGNEVVIIPVKPEKQIGKGMEPQKASKYTIRIPMLNVSVLLKGIFSFIKYPKISFGIIFKILMNSGSFRKVVKNLSVYPKGIVTGELVAKLGVEHIHCHWASTPSTVGYIASKVSGISWSFTAHRWDIAENNMLKEKARTVKFIRVIDQPGYNEMISFIEDRNKNKCYKIHVGVNINTSQTILKKDKEYFVMAEAANFVDKKGHIYLIEALKELINENQKIKCIFYGDGPLKNEYENLVKKYQLDDYIIFGNKIAHDELLKVFSMGEIDCVVLPSIVTQDGEKEGIPVTLMEGMAAKLPVISTNTGGIPELLENNAGIIVEEKNSSELKKAILRLLNDKQFQIKIGENGYNKVCKEFYISNVVMKLTELFKS